MTNWTGAQSIDFSNARTQVLTSKFPLMCPCNCIGPQGGAPKCPCMMRGVVVRDGRYIQTEVDLGPA